LTKAYMLFLARWARKLSWKETAETFHSSWDKVRDAVEYIVQWGLEHRTLAPIRAIGVDEIQYAKGHKYLTLVYQIDAGLTRLLWVGKERTIESFEGFFTLVGTELASQTEFVCSDMWEPYLKSSARNALPGPEYSRPFPHRGQNDQGAGRSAECLLKRKENLTGKQKGHLRELLRFNLSLGGHPKPASWDHLKTGQLKP
jgi:transposase